MTNSTLIHNPKERGQAMVEFAMIASLFVLILVVIFDFGRAAYYYSAVYNAAREGARYGVIHPDDPAGIESAARRLTAGLNGSTLSVSRSFPDSDNIQVTVSYQFNAATPLLGMFLNGSNSMTLTSRATMQIEN